MSRGEGKKNHNNNNNKYEGEMILLWDWKSDHRSLNKRSEKEGRKTLEMRRFNTALIPLLGRIEICVFSNH